MTPPGASYSVSSTATVSSSLPSERLVLSFGVAIAACAYAYWAWSGIDRGVPWAATATLRAGMVLGAFLLLAIVLRVATHLSAPDEHR